MRSRGRSVHRVGVLIRREAPGDATVIHAVTAVAFAREGREFPPAEAVLVDWLRASPAWIHRLSLVATDGAGGVVGHVVCTRGHVGELPALALGPLSVRPDWQRRGVGSALMHAVLGAADAMDEPLVALLGSRDYYSRFGFRPASELGITPAVPEWVPDFQVRPLSAYQYDMRGPFAYPEPFHRI